MKLLDKWNKWEQDNYASVLKVTVGVMCAIPTVGFYGVVQAYYTRNLLGLLWGLVIVTVGTVLTTLLTLVVLNEQRDERDKSVRRHPVTN